MQKALIKIGYLQNPEPSHNKVRNRFLVALDEGSVGVSTGICTVVLVPPILTPGGIGNMIVFICLYTCTYIKMMLACSINGIPFVTSISNFIIKFNN